MTTPSPRARWILSCMATLLMWRCFYPVQFAWKVSMASTLFQLLGILILGSLILFLLKEFPFDKHDERQVSSVSTIKNKSRIVTIIQSPWSLPIGLLVTMLILSSVKFIEMNKKQLLAVNTGNGTYHWHECDLSLTGGLLRVLNSKDFISVRGKTRLEIEAAGFRPWYGCPH